MSAALRRPSVTLRRSSLVDSGIGNNIMRSATIMTSAHTTRHDQSGIYENTYNLEPETPVSSSRLQKVVRDVLTDTLTGQSYSQETVALTKQMADKIKQKAKEMGIRRYKYVAMVSVGPPQHAALAMSSRCVWNTKVDTFAEYTFKNSTIFAVGVVFGIYCE